MKRDNVIEYIKNSEIVGITFHTSPDGDSLGSALGLLIALKRLNKKAYIISKEKLPETFRFLPYSSEITGNVSQIFPNTDTVVTLDCGNVERLNWESTLENRNFRVINIDHHLSNSQYGDINYVDTTKSSVGEIIYQLVKELEVDIDKELATCLYTSILTDTGGFRYSNTTTLTHSIVGELIGTGVEFSDIYRRIYEDKKYSRIKLYGKVIQKLYLHNSKICIMEVSKEMLKETNEGNGDTSDLISIGMNIDEVEVAVLFKESDDGVKVSLRSKYDFDVRKLAEIFGGGGHAKAAGLHLRKSMDEAKRLVINEIEKGLI
jgi:phosphoesterase RecJ-like protein